MRSIQRSLALWLCCSIAVLLAIGGAVLFFATRATLRTEMREDLHLVAGTLGSMIDTEAGALHFSRNASVPTECDRPGGAVVFQIWREDGSVLARSVSLGEADLPLPDERAGPVRFYEVLLTGGREALATIQRGEVPAAGRPCRYQLVVAREFAAVEHILAQLKPVMFGTVLLLTLGVALLVWLLVRRGLRPLRTLEAQVHGLDATTLDRAIVLPDAPAELTVVVARIEELRERLRASFAAERRFNAAVAHELRTPIAELRTTVEVALRWPDPKGQPEALRESLAIAGQMERLVATLLALHRSESVDVPVPDTPTLLLPQVAAITARLAEAAAARRLSFEVRIPPEAALDVDPTLLRAILDILVGNAVAYAPPGSAIRLTWPAAGGSGLQVCNPAPELSPEDVERMFEPFWRKDAARTGQDHVGLGLTLARSYARVLGLRLHAGLRDQELMLTLSPPDAPRPAP